MEREETQSSGIKSFRLRGKRMTRAQNAALIRSWDRFGIAFGTQVDTKALCPDAKDVIVEIGFGMGEFWKIVSSGLPFDIVFHIEENDFREKKSLQLMVKEIRERKDEMPEAGA